MKIITRKEAEQQGLNKYFTGKPCKRGHIAERYFPSSNCSVCASEDSAIKQKNLTEEQREIHRARGRKYARENKEKISAYLVKYNANNKEKNRARQKAWYEKNKKEISERRRIYRMQSREYARQWYKMYYEENKEAIFAKRLERDRNNPNRKHIALIRATLHAVRCTRNKTRQLWGEQLCGYTREELASHIESLVSPGMAWSNYGDWNIDHIKPISLFLDEGITDPSVINALNNLQPLWAIENIQKGDSYDPKKHPSQ